MKLLASKSNEKKCFSQISAVRTGVRAYMDATALQVAGLLKSGNKKAFHIIYNIINKKKGYYISFCI